MRAHSLASTTLRQATKQVSINKYKQGLKPQTRAFWLVQHRGIVLRAIRKLKAAELCARTSPARHTDADFVLCEPMILQ